MIYESDDPKTKLDLWILPLTGEAKPTPLLQSSVNESQGQFSPDGKWFAYTSDETGRPEVYVQTFPPAGGKWQISGNSGSQPSWRRDGQELFYLDPEKKLMAVSIALEPGFEAGVPLPLFETNVFRTDLGWNKQYAPAADGRRFLINTVLQETSGSQIHVVLNWQADLKKKE